MFPVLPIVGKSEVSPMPISLLRVETITPRSAPRFLEVVDRSGQSVYDYLCLELVHWGFNEIMAWIYKLKTTCHRKDLVPPCISVFGYDGDVNQEMVDCFQRSGAIWIPRNEPRTRGKDGATIIREMVTITGGFGKPRRKPMFIDPDDYRDLSPYDATDGFRVSGGDFQDLDHLTESISGLPDEEFKDMISRTLSEIETFDA